MDADIAARIRKVRRLAEQGATEGERAAAQARLDEMIEKHGDPDQRLGDNLRVPRVSIKFTTIEVDTFSDIMREFADTLQQGVDRAMREAAEEREDDAKFTRW